MAGLILVLQLRSVIDRWKLDYTLRKFDKLEFNKNPCVYKRSTVDVNDPPAEVREAAADMGFSVEEYKKKYLNRPNICEMLTSFENACAKQLRDGKVVECLKVFTSKESVYHCSKFQEKYSDQWYNY